MKKRVPFEASVYGVVHEVHLDPVQLILTDCLIQTEKEKQDGHQ